MEDPLLLELDLLALLLELDELFLEPLEDLVGMTLSLPAAYNRRVEITVPAHRLIAFHLRSR